MYRVILFVVFSGLILFSCNKEEENRKEFQTIDSGNNKVFESVATSALSSNIFGDLNYDHYFISFFERSFSEDKYAKSLWGQTKGTPLIQEVAINAIDIPMLSGNYFNYVFDPGDSTVITIGESEILTIDQQGDIPFLFKRESTDIFGQFPAVANDLAPEILTLGAGTIRKDGGAIINWVGDQTNTLGMLINIDYLPFLSPPSLPSDIISKYIFTSDDGSYTLTSEDLNELPIDGRVRISILRGSYAIDANDILIGSIVFMHSNDIYTIIE